jgi:hypothetical protein
MVVKALVTTAIAGPVLQALYAVPPAGQVLPDDHARVDLDSDPVPSYSR